MKPHKSAWLLVILLFAFFGNTDAIITSQEQDNQLSTRKSEETPFLRVRNQDGFLTMLEERKRELTSKSSKKSKSKIVKSSSSLKSVKSNKSSQNDKHTTTECGANYCEAKQVNLGVMKSCLKGNFTLSSVYFPEDGVEYDQARLIAWQFSRFPQAIVYVEDVEEVQAALACAVDNGYKVSPRGHNHSYQGLGTMDGYVVIDMTRTCKPDEFVINKDDQGPHILQGSKYIGTMKAQAGCTNAIMLAMGDKHFREEGGLTLIGSCPSVGITGYVLGGGTGDASPYLGYAVDINKEFEIVLHNGTVVTASEDENADLYWATRGGGGGNGIITHLTYKVVAAPKQKEEKVNGKKFTVFNLSMKMKKVSFDKGAARIQEWFYDADPLITGKFGGGFSWSTKGIVSTLVYLGSWREALQDLQSTGLLDEELFQPYYYPSDPPMSRVGDAVLVENYKVLCTYSSVSSSSCPELESTPSGLVNGFTGKMPTITAFQFDSYAEAEAFNICIGAFFSVIIGGDFGYTNTTGNMCQDLGIDADNCEDLPMTYIPWVNITIPKLCTDKAVIDAMLEAAGDPSSIMNSHGPSPELLSKIVKRDPTSADYQGLMELGPRASGSALFQRFDDQFFAKLLRETSETSNHLQHAASLHVDPDETAFPWRNAAWLIEYNSHDEAKNFSTRLLDGGYTPQGYYNYMQPTAAEKWRSLYFGNHWRKLTKIRAKYDPKDVFGKPYTIESIGE